jgi:hypothetical protein
MAPFEVERPGLALDGTKALAVGAGVLGSESLGLLFEQGGDGAFDQSAADLQGQFLHDREADIRSGSLGPEGTPGDDFSPLGGELAEFADVFRTWWGARHGLASLALVSGPPTCVLALFITASFTTQSRS